MVQPKSSTILNDSGCNRSTGQTGIIALVPEAFTRPWSTRHHVLTRLARDFPVVWVEPSREWREHWFSMPRGRAPVEADPSGLYILPPRRLMPHLYRPRWLRQAVRRARFHSARDLLRANGADRVVLYLWRPEFADALDLIEHDFSCYHIDDEYSFSKTDQGNTPEEVALIRSADQVIVHSRRLLEKKGGINPRTALIPNGVDFDAYASGRDIPPDLACIPGPRIGYVGVIKSQLDLKLMLELARRLRNASFVFVGPLGVLGDKHMLWNQLSAMPNVHVLGNREPAMLPAYTQHLDVCLMCYEVTDYTNSIFPLKLNEYLAAGRPVVSSSIDAVLAFEPTVRIAATGDEWMRAIQSALADSEASDHQVRIRREMARAYDWNLLVGQIADMFKPSAQ